MDIRFDQNYITADDVIIASIHGTRVVNVPAVVNNTHIKRIGSGAFKGFAEPKRLTVPEGILEIGHRSFENCYNLRSVHLPASLVSVERDAFDGTDIIELSFWLTIPYKKYVSIREGSIRLTNGTYIFDPKVLGKETEDLIHSFMPEATSGSFRPDPRMGYLYATGGINNKDVYIFDNFAKESDLSPEDFRDERLAIQNKIKNGDMDLWFDHDEEYDDREELFDERKLYTALLFCVEEGVVSDSDISLGFVLLKGVYYFQRGIKVKWKGRDYYFICDEILTNDDRHPYIRRLSNVLPYDAEGHQWNRDMDLEQKFKLFKELV